MGCREWLVALVFASVFLPVFGLDNAGVRGPGIVAASAQPAEREKPRPRKKAKSKERKAKAAENRGIETGDVWRAETQVFTPEQLVKLEPILNASTCRNEKTGCTYQENGRPGSEASYAFRLIPWNVSRHRAFLVRNDRCGAGGCDEGLFVLIDGRWRLVTETFGVLERATSSTLGFRDLVFRPRGQPPVRLVWDGRAYREDGPAN